MGRCGTFLKISGSIIIAFSAVLYYFYLECLREQEESVDNESFETFNPEVTDAINITMPFSIEEDSDEIYVGINYLLKQIASCAVCKFFLFLYRQENVLDKKPSADHLKNISILDARTESPGDFHETGFTLIRLDEAPVTKDWRTNPLQDPNADVKKFFTQIEPYIKELYPNLKKMMWTHNVVRGGNQFGDQPKARGPHLDYHQNKEKRIEFHKTYPAMPTWITNITEANILMGKLDDDDNKLGVLLGLWKPIHPESVCDWPLAVMDARTFQPEDQFEHFVHISFGIFTFHNFGGRIVYAPRQKWYYYPFQTTNEVLIFHQYSEGKWFSNPHTSFFNKNCPSDTQSRISVEMRLAIYF